MDHLAKVVTGNALEQAYADATGAACPAHALAVSGGRLSCGTKADTTGLTDRHCCCAVFFLYLVPRGLRLIAPLVRSTSHPVRVVSV